MKNILKTHIQQLLQYGVWSREKVLAFVSNECRSTAITATGRSFYKEVTDVPLDKIRRDPFFQAFYEQNVEACIRLVEAELRTPRARLKRIIKKWWFGVVDFFLWIRGI